MGLMALTSFLPKRPPKSHLSLKALYPPVLPLDTCDTPVAPLEAPLERGGLRCSRPGCSTWIAGRAGDRLGGPGALSPLFRGALPTLIALPAVPHVPLRFGLGLLFVELRSGGDEGSSLVGDRLSETAASPHATLQFPFLPPHPESTTQSNYHINSVYHTYDVLQVTFPADPWNLVV